MRDAGERPEVCWSPRWGLLLKWPNDWEQWVFADSGRDFGGALPDDAVTLEPRSNEPTT